MKRFYEILAAAIAVLGFASCEKMPDLNIDENRVVINGVETLVDECRLQVYPDLDGIDIELWSSGEYLIRLEFAESLLGTTFDLSKPDPYYKDDNQNHYNYCVRVPGQSNVIWGIGGLADQGSLTVVKKGKNIQILMSFVVNGESYEASYSGPYNTKPLGYQF